jgi:tRNA (guanine37-N1)-methyltransferase
MKVHIITNFTDAFTSYFDSSIMRIARGKGLFEPIFYNLGDYSLQAQHRVDDKPYGGGAGALIEIEPMYRAVTSIDPENRMKKIYL